MKRKKIHIPIIPFSFELIVYDKDEEIKETFGVDMIDCYAGVFEFKNKTKLAIKSSCDVGIIVHECNHIANKAFYWIGYNPCTENDEMQSYFIQYIFEQVNKFFIKTTSK